MWFALSFMEEKPEITSIYLMTLVSQLKDEQKEEALERLSVPQKLKKSIIRGTRTAQGILRRMPLGDPALIYDSLSALDLETILFTMSLTKDEAVKKEISRYLLELRHVRPLLRGDDLKTLGIEPGPVYSTILHEVLAGRLRGELKSREDEERFIKEKLAGLKTAK